MRNSCGTVGRAAAGIALLMTFAATSSVFADAPSASGKGAIGKVGTRLTAWAGAGTGRSVLPGGRFHSQRLMPGAATVDCPSCDPIDTLEYVTFRLPRRINNKFYPLDPGTQLVYEGRISRDGTPLPHQVIFTVTDVVKTIRGVPCVVVWDQDMNQGQLVESELAFFAQDIDENVWLLGEYPEEYDGGVLVSAENTWIHGLEWAEAGVLVPGHPGLGTPGFRQAIAPENDFWDCGQVYSLSKRDRLCVPFGCYRDVLTIREWAPLDGCDAIQLKYYQKGLGVFQVGALGDPEAEILVLVDAKRLDDDARAQANQSALELDARGPENNELYAQTEPAQLLRPGHVNNLNGAGNRDTDRDVVQLGRAGAPHAFMAVTRSPMTTHTAIEYGVAQAGPVEIAVFDLAGRRIRSLVNQTLDAGIYQVEWDATNDAGRSVANGVYFANLRSGSQTVRKTLVIAR